MVIWAIYSDLKVKAFRGMETLLLGHHYVTMEDNGHHSCSMLHIIWLGCGPQSTTPKWNPGRPGKDSNARPQIWLQVRSQPKKSQKGLSQLGFFAHMKVWFTQKKPGPICRKKVVFKKTHPIFQNAFDVKLRKSYLNDPTSVSFLVDDFTRSQDTISTTQWQPQPKQHLLRETKKLRSWWKMATNHHLYLKLSLHKTM